MQMPKELKRINIQVLYRKLNLLVPNHSGSAGSAASMQNTSTKILYDNLHINRLVFADILDNW
jgi:hypothetical protein